MVDVFLNLCALVLEYLSKPTFRCCLKAVNACVSEGERKIMRQKGICYYF